MKIACIDMEGVLIPEMWPHIAQYTGIQSLAITTREEPDYVQLVSKRICILNENHLGLADIEHMIAKLAPLPGAIDFINQLQKHYRIVLVSDAFQEMLMPLWKMLGQPELRCHRFVCKPNGQIRFASYSRTHGKHEVIEEFAAMGARTLAVGDAFNDISMLRKATHSYLFCPSAETRQAAPDIRVALSYQEILNDIILEPDAVLSSVN
ncbi:bifunctional phosphoserine phosphatase/homoserine phosphotransferase ThrH [Iodobacter fluviatilis]|uniref:Bifunctional phosphoserine phosphatase/homoserine phosphotransferase ThrH n=1 Tax=Iodobacter fluviatilis TaxID=537 RepID=A0A7G3G9U8_9NEIS|nr:bifunctional phosphoserine phosphatase/homoserine phosphotransferase ThrH [Iodobacter fluviatilis]QBC43853.1 bifunctional phosphoserine phosphatase/homoserine phosphotransferase ThrH [Iodobacter fluviatilis]